MHFPKFKGQTIITEDDETVEILKLYFKDANFMTLCLCQNDDEIFISGFRVYRSWLIQDNATNRGALAIEFWREKGTFLILPSFGDKNIEIAITIIKKVFSSKNPKLFSRPQHKWLEDHKPIPVRIIENYKDSFLKNAIEKIDEFDKQIEDESNKYGWMNYLLIGKDDDFTNAVATALNFLGFKVEIMDQTLKPGERKREDLRIFDESDSDRYFSLGETKSTHRGASEGYISDIQNHQGRYSRENNCSIPNALLIINHSYDLEPGKRASRFYSDQDVIRKCIVNAIIPVDSVVLHKLCQ